MEPNGSFDQPPFQDPMAFLESNPQRTSPNQPPAVVHGVALPVWDEPNTNKGAEMSILFQAEVMQQERDLEPAKRRCVHVP